MILKLLRRVLASVPTLVGISILSFMVIRLVPGDPVLTMLGERGGSPELVEEMRRSLGLDRSLMEQYWIFVRQAVTGDLGVSIVSK